MKKIKEEDGEIVVLNVFESAGSFAENKDVARDLREQHLLPSLQNEKKVVIDYDKVDGTTQSFTHALISEAIRQFGPDIIDSITFKNCNNDVRRIIGIVVEYMQRNVASPSTDADK